jgi:hypothetical protein
MSTRTTRLPGIGEIWLVHYPYLTPGNMEKVRPGIIVGFKGDDEVIVQKLTTRKKKYNKEFVHPKLKRKTYLSPEKTSIQDYNLIRYIGKAKI